MFFHVILECEFDIVQICMKKYAKIACFMRFSHVFLWRGCGGGGQKAEKTKNKFWTAERTWKRIFWRSPNQKTRKCAPTTVYCLFWVLQDIGGYPPIVVPPYVVQGTPLCDANSKNFEKNWNFKKPPKPLKRRKSELSEYIHMLGVKKLGFGRILGVFRSEKLKTYSFWELSSRKMPKIRPKPDFLTPQHMYTGGGRNNVYRFRLKIWYVYSRWKVLLWCANDSPVLNLNFATVRPKKGGKSTTNGQKYWKFHRF